MKSFFQRLRGVLKTAVTWAATWAVGAFSLLSIGFLFLGDSSFYWQTVLPLTAFGASAGFVMGTAFSLTLAALHRRQMLTELKPFRIAAWSGGIGVLLPGAVVGLGAALGFPIQDPSAAVGLVLVLGGVAAVAGGGTVKVAQMAVDPELEAPEADQLPSMNPDA